MVDLSRTDLTATITAPGLTITTAAPGRLFLASGITIAPNTIDAGRHWLAPDRVLAFGEPPPAGFVSDVTDGFVVLDLTGPAWPSVLAMASTLSPDAIAEGRCAQTVFAGLTLLLAGHPGGLRIFVERPFAAWLLDWLSQAATSLA
jgi:sarcosine oxidase gamma subunit